MEELYFVCEDSLEGIFSGIYEAYRRKLPHDRLHIQVGEPQEYRLFATYETVEADDERAAKVARTIEKTFGTESYLAICRAIASPDPEKGEAVYKALVTGFAMENPTELMGNLADPAIHKVFELARFCGNEAHYLIEFIRFRELDNGILYATTGPKNNILTFVMPHFADRFPLENFVIFDEVRGIYGIHPAKKEWYVVSTREGFQAPDHEYSEAEKTYSELFIHFFHTIAIKERTNYYLQRNMLPIHYRKFMTEFQKNV